MRRGLLVSIMTSCSLALACGDSGSDGNDQASGETASGTEQGTDAEIVTAQGSTTVGDGDGDTVTTTMGDGDGDTMTTTMGDGDGDTMTTTMGDGDGDTMTDTTMGDGDGDTM